MSVELFASLIEASKETKLTIEVGGEVKEIEKPLFINKSILFCIIIPP